MYTYSNQVGASSAGMGDLLADYDPSPLNTTEQREAMRRASDRFLAEQEPTRCLSV